MRLSYLKSALRQTCVVNVVAERQFVLITPQCKSIGKNHTLHQVQYRGYHPVPIDEVIKKNKKEIKQLINDDPNVYGSDTELGDVLLLHAARLRQHNMDKVLGSVQEVLDAGKATDFNDPESSVGRHASLDDDIREIVADREPGSGVPLTMEDDTVTVGGGVVGEGVTLNGEGLSERHVKALQAPYEHRFD